MAFLGPTYEQGDKAVKAAFGEGDMERFLENSLPGSVVVKNYLRD
jgi:hypothetical protein